MKKKLTITGIYNDFFTGYKDKKSSVTSLVEVECTCDYLYPNKICFVHNLPSNYILTDIEPSKNTK